MTLPKDDFTLIFEEPFPALPSYCLFESGPKRCRASVLTTPISVRSMNVPKLVSILYVAPRLPAGRRFTVLYDSLSVSEVRLLDRTILLLSQKPIDTLLVPERFSTCTVENLNETSASDRLFNCALPNSTLRSFTSDNTPAVSETNFSTIETGPL